MEILSFLFIFLIGIFAGFLGASVGGGGMIVLPLLMFMGYSPHSAVAINKLLDVSTFAAAIEEYVKAKKIDFRKSIIFAVVSTISILVGSIVILNLDGFVLKRIINITILCALPFFLLNKNIGIKEKETSKFMKILGYILYFLVGIISVLVGAGGATVLLMIVTYFFGMKLVEGYASITIPNFFLALIPSIVFMFYGYVDWSASIPIMIGGFIGGIIGSKTAISKGSRYEKVLLAIVIVASIIKSFFF